MLKESPTELPRSSNRPVTASRRETYRDVRVRSGAGPRAHRGGDTDALDWRSDPRLLAILARSAKRERPARETDQFRNPPY
jgi:hypothetical protein